MQHRKNYRSLNLTGKRFGRLYVLSKNPHGRSTFVCKCDCGNTVIVSASKLLDRTISCGCALQDARNEFAKKSVKHGGSYTKLYKKYRSMLDRCYNPKNANYKRYGGRGISVCDEWRNSFEAFKDWAYKSGYDENIEGINNSIDRVDNDGNYSPENCRFATAKEQQDNRNITKFHDFRGEKITASRFADIYGIKDKSSVYRKLNRGLTLEQILDDFNTVNNLPANLLKVSDVAEEMGISRESVTRLIRNGKIKGKKVGRKWYVIK